MCATVYVSEYIIYINLNFAKSFCSLTQVRVRAYQFLFASSTLPLWPTFSRFASRVPVKLRSRVSESRYALFLLLARASAISLAASILLI